MASTSSSNTPKRSYDVFLSFQREDTHEGFTSYLCDALRSQDIETFIDDEIPRGESISRELEEKIEESRISIVVLSENYASSGCCLDELVKILEIKKTMDHQVWPIFYRISPSEVRHQTGKTGEYLAKHRVKYKDNLDKVEKWRKALKELANLSGWPYTSEVEVEFIKKVVEEVSKNLKRPASSVAARPPGGMNTDGSEVTPPSPTSRRYVHRPVVVAWNDFCRFLSRTRFNLSPLRLPFFFFCHSSQP